jgi:DNA-binding PadR family transcriptional regulator
MEPAPGRRDKVGTDREPYEEKEDTMPRFGRGLPGFEKPQGRHFDRGDVKYVLLDLLREGPRHGYDMIKELEQRSGGLYSPSPGSVYPTLQMLEDQGLVTSTTVDGKRTYRLTDAGYAFIEERKERTHDARGRSWLESEHFREELRSMGREAGELARSLRHAVQSYTPDPQQMKEIRDVIGETRKRIEAILAERREAPRDDDHGKPTVV